MYKDGIRIVRVKNPQEGIDECKLLLYQKASKNSVLFLSGGSTPKPLYEDLVKKQKLNIGAVALVDERFGKKLHENSNEKMIRDTGLVSYTEKHARFYPILENKNIDETAKDYDETVRFLFNYFRKSIGILGIGIDGHTAGLPSGMTNDQFSISNKTELVTSFDNFPGKHKERISLTFLGLSKLDLIIILVFGKEKKKALREMFKQDSMEEIPARFFLRKEIAEKTILITDQEL